MVGIGGVGKVVFDWLDFDFFQVEVELLQVLFDVFVVMFVVVVVEQDCIQCVIWCVGVVFGVVLVGFFYDVDGSEGNCYYVDIGWFDFCLFQVEFC